MSYDEILQWFEKNPQAKPNDLPEDIAIFMRAAHGGQIAASADFLARLYVIHLKRMGKPVPKGPADYTMEFVEKASDFFDYMTSRCFYNFLLKKGLVIFQDVEQSLIESDLNVELKVEETEAGRKFVEEVKKQIEEASKKAAEQASQKETKPAPPEKEAPKENPAEKK